MSDLAERIDLAENAELLIQQWRRAPRMRALALALLHVVSDHLIEPTVDVERRLRIETADGFWLDCIGKRLDIPRPAVMATVSDFPFFGFQGSGGVGFDQGIFATANPALSPRVPAGDTFYRVILRIRSGTLVADGSVPSLEEAILQDFPEAAYEDSDNMTVTLHVTDTRTQLLNLLSATDTWPKPAGVALTVDTS